MRLLVVIFLSVFLSRCSINSDVSENKASSDIRIVALSGAATETLDAMGHGQQIVGVDVTSTYPSTLVDTVAKLGHVSNLNTEALLALHPDLVMVDGEDTLTKGILLLKDAGIELLIMPESNDLRHGLTLAQLIKDRLGDPDEQLEVIRNRMELALLELEGLHTSKVEPLRVLFVYARGLGSLLVAGDETSAAYMIKEAGGVNAAAGLTGYKALTPEALLAEKSDVLLFFESGLESLGGLPGLNKVVGLDQTPAGQKGQVISMDGQYLLGFTPRAPEAAVELAKRLREFSLKEAL